MSADLEDGLKGIAGNWNSCPIKAPRNRLEKKVYVVLPPSAGSAVSVMPWNKTSLPPTISPVQQEQQRLYGVRSLERILHA